MATPTAGLDGTVAPLFTLGYRLRDDLGSILLSYRNLATEGRDVIGNYGMRSATACCAAGWT